ncbi:MAG: hypothetical protein P1P88_25380, partial [Bacteroidales bacterium]|nr:hypothetical protein [Bacteroidales bacterium]
MKKSIFYIIIILNLSFCTRVYAQSNTENIEVLISTFLGNGSRNYYGNEAPERLDSVWKIYLGEGISPAYGTDKVWKGAGWTGQPL